MTKELLYWVLMLFWLVFGIWIEYVPNQPYPFRRLGGNLLIFILFVVLGWQVFGSPIK